MTSENWFRRRVASLKRWREDRASLMALARLEPLAWAEFETLLRLQRDASTPSPPRRGRGDDTAVWGERF